MCNAEDDLRSAERELAWWSERFDLLVEMACDVERGIIDLAEFRREAEALRCARVPA